MIQFIPLSSGYANGSNVGSLAVDISIVSGNTERTTAVGYILVAKINTPLHH
jgi:hypothetical protein